MNPDHRSIGVVVNCDVEERFGIIAPRKGRNNLYFDFKDVDGEVSRGSLVRFEMAHHKGVLHAQNIQVIND